MKRTLSVVTIALVMAAIMVLMAAPVFAKITQSTNQGHPDTNPAGMCPQNQDLNPGAAKKCP